MPQSNMLAAIAAHGSRAIETPLNLREVGRLRVLQALYDAQSLTRSGLARTTGLSRATVSSVASDLLAAGLLEEGQPDLGDQVTGRPGQPLTLRPSAAYALGADIGHQHIRVALCDLSGTPVWSRTTLCEVDHAPHETLNLIADLIARALREGHVDPAKVLGLGVDIAAPIRSGNGQLEARGIMAGWVGFQPAKELQQRTGLPTRVENDATVGARAERKYGAGKDVDDMIYVRLSAGIGAGIISGGRPVRGAGGLAGEIGHIVVVPNGLICRCGNRGCLETVASPAAIAQLLSDSWRSSVSVTDLVTLLNSGDPSALRALNDAAEQVGRVLATVVTLLNPELIVIGGDLAGAGHNLIEPISRAITRHALSPAVENLRVTVAELGEHAEVLGAATMILDGAPGILAAQLAR
ncbi:ROK family transcriptional regulator [Pseudoxanthomonas sacheonensis]|uniref:NBD/HSP70 family sugar kinase n=1 Tax=Pseudoxanthomonas sacheonensis TaxID=443615 RepID=A0ABU1RWS2_9GAMM|nr:ROK family transcriptional regulator [Pseudoxanthomonas sacheonensis]MDR6843212.1 putative NBD/HSP70 family sugar kinase [Pseudoxanthomonas sacheonensis]